MLHSTVSPSANWYLASALTSSLSGMTAYAAKSTTVVLNENMHVIHHLNGHKRGAKITAVSFSQHSATDFLLASGGSNRKICVWNAVTGLLVEEHSTHTKEVSAMTSSSLVPGLFISGDKAGRIVITTATACLGLATSSSTSSSTPSITRELRPGPESCVSCIAASPYDSDTIVVGYESGALVVMNIRKEVAIRRLAGHTRGVQSVSWMPIEYQQVVNERSATASIKEKQRRESRRQSRKRSKKQAESSIEEKDGGKDGERDGGKKEKKEKVEVEVEVEDEANDTFSNLNCSRGKLVYTPDQLCDLRPPPPSKDQDQDQNKALSSLFPIVSTMPQFILEERSQQEDKSVDSGPILASSSRDRSIRFWSSTTWRSVGQLVLPTSGGGQRRKKGKKKNHHHQQQQQQQQQQSGGMNANNSANNVVYYDGGASLTDRQRSRLWLTMCWISPTPHGEARMVTSSWMGELLLWKFDIPRVGQNSGSRTKKSHRGGSGNGRNSSSGGGRGGADQARVITCAPPIVVQHGHLRPVFNIMRIAKEMDLLVTTSMDRRMGVWDISGRGGGSGGGSRKGGGDCCVRKKMVPGLGGHVYALATTSAAPHSIAMGVGDNTIRVWDVENEEETDGTEENEKRERMTVIWKPIQSKVTALCWHPTDGTTLAFGTEDGYVGLVDIVRGASGSSGDQRTHVVEAVHLSPVRQLYWDAVSNVVISLSSRGKMRATSFNVTLFEVNNVTNLDDQMIMMAEETEVEVLPVEMEVKVQVKVKEATSVTTSFLYLPTVHQLIVGTKSGDLITYGEKTLHSDSTSEAVSSKSFWDNDIQVEERTCPHDQTAITSIVSTEVDEDGVVNIASSGGNGSVCVHTLMTTAAVATTTIRMVSFCKKITALSWNNNVDSTGMKMLAGASSDGQVGVWKWSNKVETLQGAIHLIVRGHSEAALCCVWSHLHHDVLFTGGADQTTRAWRIPQDVDAKKVAEDNATVSTTAVSTTAAKERKQRKRGKGNSSNSNSSTTTHRKSSNHPLTALEVDVIKCGQLARVLQSRMGTGTMTLELVALSPSCGMWDEAMASYVTKMKREGKVDNASLSLFASCIQPLHV